MKRTVSSIYNISIDQIEFVDIPLDSDLLVFADPILIENCRDNNRLVKNVNNRLNNFMRKLRGYVKQGDKESAIALLMRLGEPNEYHLGYSSENKGNAVGSIKAESIYEALRSNKYVRQKGSSIIENASSILLLVEGIGPDNMSDIILNVCRDYFADFTKEMCDKYHFDKAPVEISFYDDSKGCWSNKVVEVLVHNKKHIILLPKYIVCGKRDYPKLYNNFVARDYIAPDICSYKKEAKEGMLRVLKNGKIKPVLKVIAREHYLPKNKLVELVIEYPKSLPNFLAYSKLHYLSIAA